MQRGVACGRLDRFGLGIVQEGRAFRSCCTNSLVVWCISGKGGGAVSLWEVDGIGRWSENERVVITLFLGELCESSVECELRDVSLVHKG
jgi:hypothetical protein